MEGLKKWVNGGHTTVPYQSVWNVTESTQPKIHLSINLNTADN